MSKVKELRIAQRTRFSQAECAKAIGVSRPTYKKLEENPEDFTKAQALKLAQYLGCSEKDIFL